MEQEQTITRVGVAADNGFLQQVYAWMAGGLLATAVTSFVVLSTPAILEAMLDNIFIFYGLLLAELGLVIYLSARVSKMSAVQAKVVYFIYSILNGVTLSLILLVYTSSSVASAFLITAGTFAVVSVYGYLTKRDLTTVGHYAFMALIGVIIATVVNMFLRNSGFDLMLSYITVLVFVALTAYDTQKLKELNANMPACTETAEKAAVMGALTLYLDFINLFLNILRIMGRRR